MIKKNKEKIVALRLRKQGKTYGEILKEVQVAKSTLSVWLREVDLSKKQIQVITVKKLEAQKKGALARKSQRLIRTADIFAKSKIELGAISKRDLFILGVALYWAEGSKERAVQPGSGIQFANSDPKMVHLFARWLTVFAEVSVENITVDLYLHVNHKHRLEEVVRFWETETQLSVTHTYYKRHNPKTPRKNSGENYHGLVVLKVRSSSHIVRRLAGLVRAIEV